MRKQEIIFFIIFNLSTNIFGDYFEDQYLPPKFQGQQVQVARSLDPPLLSEPRLLNLFNWNYMMPLLVRTQYLIMTIFMNFHYFRVVWGSQL